MQAEAQQAVHLTRPPTGLLSQAAVELVASSSVPAFDRGFGSTWAGSRGSRLQSSASQPSLRGRAGSGNNVFRNAAKSSGLDGSQGSKTVFANSTARQDGRPSTVARNENNKKERFTEQLRNASQGPQSPGRQDLQDTSADRIDSVDVLAEVFRKDMLNVTGRLDEMTRGLRMDNLKSKQEDRDRQKREEERRQLEAEKRLARKREQAARDPKKKVALRLENRRRFAEDDKHAVPMCAVNVDGVSGRETVNMVDITAIRQKCLRLGEGTSASVESLIDLQRIKDKAAQDKLAMKALVAANGERGQSKEIPVSDLTWEERHENVLAKRKAAHIEDVLRKLNKMRSELPTTMALNTAAVEKLLEQDRQRRNPSNGVAPLQDSAAEQSDSWEELFGSLADKLAATPASKGSDLAKSLTSLSKAVTGDELVIQKKDSGGAALSTRRRTEFDVAQWKEMKRQKVRKLWAAAKALVQWLKVFSRTKKRHRSMHIVQVILKDLGEWARVKIAMRRVVAGVRSIQAISREFLALKMERCRRISEDWQRIENRCLEKFFKKYSQQLIKEQLIQAEENPRANANVKARQEQRGFYEELMNAVKDGQFAIDWKKFVIPPDVRAKVISGYYMGLLRTKVRTTGDLLKTTKIVLAKHRELVGFLQQFGGKMESGEGSTFLGQNENANIRQRSFWEVSEDTMLHLIALSAQILRATGTEPFADHPAHKDLPGNFMYRPETMDFKAIAADGLKQLDQAMIRVLSRSSLRHSLTSDKSEMTQKEKKGPRQSRRPSKSRATSKPPTRAGTASASRSATAAPAAARPAPEHSRPGTRPFSQAPRPISDLEDVFEAFTPRLREIKEEQLLEYRINNPPTESQDPTEEIIP
mmetsp:Transcript_73410/g.129530  ORF Transcript_73410/g.129530 Transcript_73410/m.129530 type:complete len:871 (-) Transcript_73410:101-2713(-)